MATIDSNNKEILDWYCRYIEHPPPFFLAGARRQMYIIDVKPCTRRCSLLFGTAVPRPLGENFRTPSLTQFPPLLCSICVDSLTTKVAGRLASVRLIVSIDIEVLHSYLDRHRRFPHLDPETPRSSQQPWHLASTLLAVAAPPPPLPSSQESRPATVSSASQHHHCPPAMFSTAPATHPRLPPAAADACAAPSPGIPANG